MFAYENGTLKTTIKNFLDPININISKVRFEHEIYEIMKKIFGRIHHQFCNLIITDNKLIINNLYCDKNEISIYQYDKCSNLIMDIKCPHYSVKFKFYKNNSFPFQSPSEIKLNNKDYLSIIRNINKNFLELIGIGNDIKCLCCESIICSNNWSPTIKIVSILNEIDKNVNYKMLYIYYLHLKVITRKYLNNDLEKIILSYLI